MSIARSHLLSLVVLTKACCCALCQFLELGRSVVEATKVACECRFGIRADRPASVDAIKATNLLFISFQHFFWVKNLESVLQQIDLTLVITRCVCSHGWTSIDLNQPWTQLVIKQDIETVELEAVLIIDDCFSYRLE